MTRKQIEITLEDGSFITVKADVLGSLAVHRSHIDETRFVLTHIPSSRCILHFLKKSNAVDCMKEIEPLINWKTFTEDQMGVAEIKVIPVLNRFIDIETPLREKAAQVNQ